MSQQQSLADQAVQTLAAVSSMCDDVGLDSVERHIIRGMKRIAEQSIENGLRMALDLAYQAEQLIKDLKVKP